MSRPAVWLGAAVLGMALGASGCAASPSPSRHGLYGATDGSHTEVCGPADPGGRFIIGDFVTPPPHGASVHIDAVRLVHASGLKLIHTWLLPVGEGVGGLNDPPEDFPQWEDRTAAIGADVAGDEPVPIAFELERTGSATGRATAARIAYTIDDKQFTDVGTMRFVLASPCP